MLTSAIYWIFWLFCGCIGFFIGANKGRGLAGFLWGLLLGPLGILVIAIVPNERRRERFYSEYSDDTRQFRTYVTPINHQSKACPDCAETIKAAARRCRFCGCQLDLASGVINEGNYQEPGASLPETPTRRVRLGETAASRMSNRLNTNTSSSSGLFLFVSIGVIAVGAGGFFLYTNRSTILKHDNNQERQALYTETMNSLRSVRNPPQSSAYRIAASSAPPLEENPIAQTASATPVYANDLSYVRSADQRAVQNVFSVRDNLKGGNHAAAARDADECLWNARLTGDPEAIGEAQVLRDAVRRTTGY